MIRSKYQQFSDTDLVKACLKNKRQAQRELYDRFSGKMRGIALRYMKDEDEANDVLQEAFIAVFQQLDKYTDQGNLGGWIHRVTVNAALQQFRKQKTRQTHYDSFGNEQSEQTVNDVLHNLELSALLEKIQALPDGFRMIFNLRAIEGYTHKEIAEMLGISEGTSKSQYARARKQLQTLIVGEETILDKRLHGS